MPYHSPHKFRHCNAVYALKAVSQNLMHANLSITDGVYGILSDDDVRRKIATLGQIAPIKETKDIEELKDTTTISKTGHRNE